MVKENVFRLSSIKLNEAYNQFCYSNKIINIRNISPVQFFTTNYGIGVDPTCFTLMIADLISMIHTKPKCVNALRQYFGNNNWQNYIRLAFLDEITCAYYFIQLNNTISTSIDDYANYMSSKVTIGTWNMLKCSFKEIDLLAMDPIFGRCSTSYTGSITLDAIKSACNAFGIDPSQLVVPSSNGKCILTDDDMYVFACIKEHFPSFDYSTRKFDWNVLPLDLPVGDVMIVNGSNEGSSSFIQILDTADMPTRIDVAFNFLYNVSCISNSDSVTFNFCYRSINQLPNLADYQDLFCYIWTGLLPDGTMFSAYEQGRQTNMPTEPNVPPGGVSSPNNRNNKFGRNKNKQKPPSDSLGDAPSFNVNEFIGDLAKKGVEIVNTPVVADIISSYMKSKFDAKNVKPAVFIDDGPTVTASTPVGSLTFKGALKPKLLTNK